MLLFFAQLERGIAGERIRDKIAVFTRKGISTGGIVPLGCDVKDRKLLVNAVEAETVRFIFKHFAELEFVALHEAELKLLGDPSNARQGVSGRISGGQLFLRSNLCLILRNYVYRGEVALKRNAYPGQNEVIVDADMRPLKTRSGRVCWLGREGSNLRMAESKSAALPLGYAPTSPGLGAGRKASAP